MGGPLGFMEEVVDVRGQGCMQRHGARQSKSKSQGNCQYDLPSQQENGRVPSSLPRILFGSYLGLEGFALDLRLSTTRLELSTVY